MSDTSTMLMREKINGLLVTLRGLEPDAVVPAKALIIANETSLILLNCVETLESKLVQAQGKMQ